jgi:lipoprotein NlpD
MMDTRAILCMLCALAVAGCATTNNAPVVDRSTVVLTPAASVPPVEAEHVVASGDTLYGIAFRHGLDYRRLAAWNAIAPPYLIRPGQRLRLGPPPDARGPDFSDVAIAGAAEPETNDADFSDVATTSAVQEPPAPAVSGPVGTFAAQESDAPVVVDTLGEPAPAPVPRVAPPARPMPPPVAARPVPPPITATPATTAQPPTTTVPAAPARPATSATPSATAAATPANAPTAAPSTTTSAAAPAQVLATGPTRTVAGITWSWPTRGQVVGRFIADDPARQGIDISGTAGSPVQAAAAGEVVYSGNGLIGYGELVIIKHSAEFLSAYGHNSRRLVKEGDRVKAGQVIAEMGRSAAAQDVLHFEVRRGGRPSDPLQYLPSR